MSTGDPEAPDRRHVSAFSVRTTDAAADVLRPAAGALGLWYALMACLHLVLLEDPARQVMFCAASASAVTLLVLWYRLGRSSRLGQSPTPGGLVGALVAGNSLLHLFVSGDPAQSANVIMAVIGIGALIEHRGWACSLVVPACATWVAIAMSAPPDDEWLHYGIGMSTAVALAGLLYVTRARTVRRLATAEATVRRAAVTDELTGLSNRRGLLAAARPLVLSAARAGTPVTVLYVDVNGLKQVNDTQGHAAGDRIISRAGVALSQALREADVLARVGGDEFAAVLSGSGVADVPTLVDRVHRALADAGVSASCGAAHPSPGSEQTLEFLLERADAAMYAVKRQSAAR